MIGESNKNWIGFCEDLIPYNQFEADAYELMDKFYNPKIDRISKNTFDGLWSKLLNKNRVMNKEEKIKEIEANIEALKKNVEDLKNEKEVLRWDDLEGVEGWIQSPFASVVNSATLRYPEEKTTTFKTKEQAEASVALAKISQLLPVYNEGWTPDYEAHAMGEDSIGKCYNYHVGEVCYYSRLLCFKDAYTLRKFLENNRDLIEQAKPLL